MTAASRNRKAALTAGRKHYIGAPCPTHGDKAPRYVVSKSCVACDREWHRRKREAARA